MNRRRVIYVREPLLGLSERTRTEDAESETSSLVGNDAQFPSSYAALPGSSSKPSSRWRAVLGSSSSILEARSPGGGMWNAVLGRLRGDSRGYRAVSNSFSTA